MASPRVLIHTLLLLFSLMASNLADSLADAPQHIPAFRYEAEAVDESLALLAPPSQEFNASNQSPAFDAGISLLSDRSLELVQRQQCNQGYGYCAGVPFPHVKIPLD